MTVSEMSNLFDTYMHSQSMYEGFNNPEYLILDEYEKSVFLTRAQKELVLALYEGKYAGYDGFESSEELRRFLSPLVKEASLYPITTSNGLPLGIASTSKFFSLPEDLWFITYEAAVISSDDCFNGTSLDVVPTSQNEYHKVKRNPFRGANNRRVLRLDLADNVVELVSTKTISTYYLRYISQLSPIILVSLPQDLSIDGKREVTACQLPESLHDMIVQGAVSLAVSTKGLGANTGSKQQESNSKEQ